jgi:flagellar motor switch protein FliN/FliY
VSDAILSPEELEAIQRATGGARRSAVITPTDVEVTPIALIADDREGERARPRALAVANRWAPALAARLKRAFNLDLEFQVEGADVADGAYVAKELGNTWCRALTVAGGKLPLVVSVGGPLVEVVAAILLGAKLDEDAEPPPEERAPSAMARKVFTRGGRMMLASLLEVWREDDHRHLEVIDDLGESERRLRAYSDGDAVIVVTLSVESPVAGRVRLVGTPEAFIAPRPVGSVQSVPRAVVLDVLGGIAMELVVELGGARIPMRDVKRLAPGTLIKLDRSMSEPVPVRCDGVVKARGQVISQNGNFAVEIVDLVRGTLEEE